MKRRHVLPLGFLLLAGVLCPGSARPDARPEPVRVPFTFTNNMIILEVRINDQGPFRMLLDTGANVSVIDRAVAERLGVKLGKVKTLGEYYGSDASRPTYQNAELRRVQIGGLEVEEVTAVAADLSRTAATRSTPAEPLHGILGYAEVLHHRAVRVDYPQRTVTFFPRSPITEADEKRPNSPDRSLVSFGFRDGLMERLAGIHGGPKLRVRVNGRDLHAQVDTGYNGAFALTHEATVQLGLTQAREHGTPGEGAGAGGALKYRAGQLDRVEVGSIVAERPRVIFLPESRQKRDYGINIGNAFLKDWVVTLDYRKKKILFEKPTMTAAP